MVTLSKILFMSAAGVLLAVSSGCSKDNGESSFSGIKLDNYIAYYIQAEELFVRTTIKGGSSNLPENGAEYSIGDFMVNAALYPTMVGGDPSYGGRVYSKEERNRYRDEHFIRRTPINTDDVEYDEPYNPKFNRLYDSLSIAHGDTRYSKNEKHYSGDLFIYPALYRAMKLDVVSDADYDAAHPAGTSLKDILHLRGYSAKEVIENDYDLSICKGESINFGYVMDGTLSRFNDEYRKLVGGWFRIGLGKAPAATSVHRFTVTYTDEDGRTFSSVTSPVKIKGGK